MTANLFLRKAGSERLTMRRGTCEMCGKEEQDLRILFIDDFAGWACTECIKYLEDCIPRRYCSAWEETEPGE